MRHETQQLYGIVDTSIEPDFDAITTMLADLLDMPVAMIHLVDKERVWVKSLIDRTEVGLGERSYALAHHLPFEEGPMVIEDVQTDERFETSPLGFMAQSLRFYAGIPIRTPEGHVLGSLCVMDTKPRSLSEVQIRALETSSHHVMKLLDLRRVNGELTQKTYLLQEAIAQKDKFFSMIAHDLRAPFHGIMGFSEILATEQDQMSASEITRTAQYLHETSETTYRLLESLLSWTVSAGGFLEQNPITITLEQLVLPVLRLLHGVALLKEVSLEMELHSDLPVFVDRNMMVSVLQNLISNAIKFTASGGSVRVRSYKHRGYVTLQVIDSGIGMTADQIKVAESAFDKGSRLKSTNGTSGEAGCGLGLLLCHQFLDVHGSHMRIESTPGQGTLIEFDLPRRQNARLPRRQLKLLAVQEACETK